MLARISNEGGFIRLYMTGRLDGLGIASLRSELVLVAQHADGDVMLDLSDVTFMDGCAIGAISYLYKRMVASRRMLWVAGAIGQPREMMDALGLSATLGLTPTRRPRAAANTWRQPVAAN